MLSGDVRRLRRYDLNLGLKIGFYARKVVHDIVLLVVPRTLLKKSTPCRKVMQHANALDQSQYSRGDRLRIFIHKLWCHCCWLYERQIIALKVGAKKLDAQELRNHLDLSGEKMKLMCQEIIEKYSK